MPLLFLFIGCLATQQLEGADTRDPVSLYRELPADSVDARRALIDADAVAFQAGFDSVLVSVDINQPDWKSTLESASEDYLTITADSLLLSDLQFIFGADPEMRQEWYLAVQTDARGSMSRDTGDFEAAVEAFHTAATAYRKLGHLRREAVAWGSLGVAYWYAGDLEEVKKAYINALETRQRLGDPVLIGRTLNGLGSVNLQLGNFRTALDYYHRAGQVREKLDRPIDLGTTLTYIGHVQFRLGKLDEARTTYLRALEIFGPDVAEKHLLDVKNGLANVHSVLGDHRKAQEIYQELVLVAEKSGDVRKAAGIRRNLAGTRWILGEHAAALRELNRARDAQEAAGDPFEMANTVNDLGNVYLDLGDLSRALEAFKEAEQLATASGNELTRGDAVANIGFVHSELGLYTAALETFERALAIHEALENPTGVRTAYSLMAGTHVQREEFVRALELFRKVLELDTQSMQLDNVASDHGNIGNQLTALGRFAEGLVAYREGARLARELERRDFLWPCLQGMADNFEQAGSLDSARVYNNRAIEVMESLRGQELSSEMRTEFLRKRAAVYEGQVNLLGKLVKSSGDITFAEEAFGVAERGKARALLDMLAEGRVDLDAGLDPALVDRRDRLERDLNAVRYQLRLTLEDEVSADSLRWLKNRLRSLENEQTTLLERMRLENPRFAALDAGRPGTLKEIREQLLGKKDHALVEFSLGDSASYAWMVKKKELIFFELPPREIVEAEVQKLRRGLINPLPVGDKALVEAAVSLYTMLLKPGEEFLNDVKTVYIVPDGALHFIPFDVLLKKSPMALDSQADSPARNRYFAELPYAFRGTRVVYGPSATTLATLVSRRSRKDGDKRDMELLAIGAPIFVTKAETNRGNSRAGLDPLPFTRDEVESIGAYFDPSRSTLLLGEAAREKSLVRAGFLSRYRIIHFATHGLVDERRPERSSLVLSHPQDPSEDGYLQASEIYRLNIEASVVVLSACETGLGRMVRGEGILGLPRAFLYAGASSVVVSLWSVSDRSTADLMAVFYEQMTRENRESDDALARTKERLRQSDTFAHPFYWAPFILMGVPAN